MNRKQARQGQEGESARSSGQRKEVWEKRSEKELEQVSRNVMLGILRSLHASSFRVEKGKDGGFYCTFFEGQLADELGLTTHEVYGKPVEEVFPEEVHDELQGRLQRALEGEVQEWIVKHKDRHYEFQLPAAGLFTEGSAVGSIADVTDRVVTDESKAELVARLEQTQTEVEQMTYTLSHDLRNPLTIVLSLCEVAEREIEAGKGDPLKRLHKIRQSANRMNEMLGDLLKLSRSRRIEPTVKEVDVSALAKQILGQMASSQPRRDVDFHVEEGINLKGDPHFMRDLLENLISNAWKYTGKEENPRIVVGSMEQDDERWVYVRDNGIGFSPEERERLFEPFTRLDSAADFHGTGVGLATAKRIVERQGGRLRAHGELGRGATFSFTLPNRPAERAQDQDPGEPKVPPVTH